MRRKGNLFDSLCGFENLYRAFKKAWHGSGQTAQACRFYFHLETSLLQLKEALEGGIYQPAAYHYFKIHDPKERLISVAPFRDRVVHHALVNILEPIFEPTFIFDSYATRKAKGTHRAVRRAQSFLRQNMFYLKTDVAKYFHSIDHDILLTLLQRKVKDRKVMSLAERIIRNADGCSETALGKGLPIGNLTSQFFANVYLDPLDHYSKDERGWTYIRYMDDMVLFSNSREALKHGLRQMGFFLQDKLTLSLNAGMILLNRREHGLPFLGFRIFPRMLRMKKVNLKRIAKRMDQRKKQYAAGLITEDKYVMGVRAVFNHVEFADTWHLRRSHLVSRAGAI